VFCAGKVKNFTKEQEQWMQTLLAMKRFSGDQTAFMAVIKHKKPVKFGLPFSNGDYKWKEGDIHPETNLPIKTIDVFRALYGTSLSSVVSCFAFDCLMFENVTVTLHTVPLSSDNNLGLIPDWNASGYYPHWYVRNSDKEKLYTELFESCYNRGNCICEWSALIQKIMLDQHLLPYMSKRCETDYPKYSRDLWIRADSTFESPVSKTFTFRDGSHAKEFSHVVDVLRYGSSKWEE
jgi:hypothetical protein